MRQRGSGLRSVWIGWEDMLLPRLDDRRNCFDPRHLGQSQLDQMLGQLESVFSWYDKMRSKWDDVDLLPVTLSTSVTPVFPYTRCFSVNMYLQSVIERVWRCTWSLWLSEFGDALGGRDHANLQAVMGAGWRYTWTLWLSEFGGHHSASLEIHLEAVIKWVWEWTRWPWLGELGGRNRAYFDIHFQAMIEWT